MKILIISDLHSNVEGVKAIWAQESDADAIYASGDYVDYGTDPIATIDWLKAHNVHCVQGNHDEKLIKAWYEGTFNDLPPEKFDWVHHNCQRMTQEYVDFLETLPVHLSFEVDNVVYLMSHRSGEGYATIESQYHFDKFWEEHCTIEVRPGMQRRMIFGHSHRQVIQQFAQNALWFNPGSASYRRPDEPSKDAFYAVVENGCISLRHVPYNRKPLYEEAVRVRPTMREAEWHVANFFFGWSEEDGPDTEWIERKAAHQRKLERQR